MLNLDTHVLLFTLAGSLDSTEEQLLRGDTNWGISAIVLWEVAKLVQLKRVETDLKLHELLHLITDLHIWPIDAAISQQAVELDFASDPADEIIAATSIVHKVPLVTRDQRIKKSEIVPFPI